IEEQRPLHERAMEYEGNPDLVHSILQEGREHARDAARDTLEEVRAAMGLHYR
ncbi:MAG: tryptophan--tRNA ligase, partial [Pseudomonadota bacterium]|nr:tryptophan--tRNA ligase [Pseudomonadota bacterium]